MVEGIGLGLSRRFYENFVAPIIQRRFPNLPHAAARLGLGSEVLGYDTAMSADHDYGPCVQIFVPAENFDDVASALLADLDAALPETFEGLLVRYPTAMRPPSGVSGQGMLGSSHGAEFYTLDAWCDRFLGRRFDGALAPADWLGVSDHLFLAVTAGAVFRDDLLDLTRLRQRLDYFPRDVWLYRLAAQWGRIAEDRAYVGRAGEVGDELGSRIVAARMVGNMMRLALLIERRYAPYPKWFGTAFGRLESAPVLGGLFTAALDAARWEEREARLYDACAALAELQLARNIPGAIPPVAGRIHDRPFRFVDTVGIAASIRSAIDDAALRDVPGFGGADQFLGNFVLAVPDWSRTATEGLLHSIKPMTAG